MIKAKPRTALLLLLATFTTLAVASTPATHACYTAIASTCSTATQRNCSVSATCSQYNTCVGTPTYCLPSRYVQCC